MVGKHCFRPGPQPGNLRACGWCGILWPRAGPAEAGVPARVEAVLDDDYLAIAIPVRAVPLRLLRLGEARIRRDAAGEREYQEPRVSHRAPPAQRKAAPMPRSSTACHGVRRRCASTQR